MRRDADRYFYAMRGDARVGMGTRLRAVLLFPGLLAVMLYRICHHLLCAVRPNALTKLAYALIWLVGRPYMIVVGIEIDPHAHIGGGLFINHFGSIIISSATIGENCNIAQNVTIGMSSKAALWELEGSGAGDSPTVGDRVWIGSGAVIAGPVTVGDDASVAANSLVTRDIPPAGIVMGVPAQVVSTKGSFRQVAYRGMDVDTDRTAALFAAQAVQASQSLRSDNP
jgi:serine O-acetyltransferase